jgi:hypothetical protein
LNVYILTEECPEDVYEFAEHNWERYVTDLEEDNEKYAYINENELVLGNPFKLYYEAGESYTPLYYFPIIFNDKIVFTLRVYEETDDVYRGIRSEILVDELMALSEISSLNNPVLISVNNGNIVASVNGWAEIIIPDSQGNSISEIALVSSDDEFQIINIVESLDVYEIDEQICVPAADVIIPIYHNLQLDLIETQGQNNWCAAYCCSSIIRYLTSYDNVFAETIIRAYHPYMNSNALTDVPLQVSEELSYASNFGLYPTLRNAGMTIDEVAIQIANGVPVQFDMESDAAGNHNIHAIVCRGYDKRYNTYSVWNPWYPSYESMDATTNSYTAYNGARYVEVIRSFYDWYTP